jgi:hypothetical protein
MKDNSKLAIILGWVAICVGAVLLIASFYVPEEQTRVTAIFLGLGIALFPAGIFIILSEYNYSSRLKKKIEEALNASTESLSNSIEGLEDAIEYLNKSKTLGVFMVYRNREEGLGKFLDHLEKYVNNPTITNKKAIFVGSSLKGVLETKDYGERISKLLSDSYKYENSTDFNFLLTHPSYSMFREIQEDRAETDIAKEILHAIAWLENHKVPKENIKVYKGTPTCFMMTTTETMLINPYPYEIEAYKCFCFEVINNKKPDSIYRSFYENHYLKPWKGFESDRDHYKTPSALSYFHDYFDGPIFKDKDAKRTSDRPLGDIFFVDDKGSFYLAINIIGLEKQIPYKDKKIKLGDNRRGFWHKTLSNKAMSAYKYIGLFDPNNLNQLCIELPKKDEMGLILWKEVPIPH